MKGATLHLYGVVAGYPSGGEVLREVSLDVQPGEVVGLVGANGAGKTTVLRAISGVIASRGVIEVDGEELRGRPFVRAMRGVAHVPEGRRVYGGLTVRENLLLGVAGRPRGQRGAGPQVAEIVADVFPELEKHLDRSGTQLSGGEQQMVALGRALMAHPRLVLLDEPTLGLAPIVVERLVAFLTSGAVGGSSVLVAEENLAFVTKVSSRCYALRAGRTVWSGQVGGHDSQLRRHII